MVTTKNSHPGDIACWGDQVWLKTRKISMQSRKLHHTNLRLPYEGDQASRNKRRDEKRKPKQVKRRLLKPPKLIDISLVIKDNYGNYIIKEKVGFKGQVWIDKNLVLRGGNLRFYIPRRPNWRSRSINSTLVYPQRCSEIFMVSSNGHNCRGSHFSRRGTPVGKKGAT